MIRKAVVFALVLAVASCRPYEEAFDCTGKENGPHADATNNGYFVCLNEQFVVRVECKDGEVFDDNLKICVGGPETEALTNSEAEVDDKLSADEIKSEVTHLLEESPEWSEDEVHRESSYKVYNIQISENVFPNSVIVIGKANREQKNK